MRQSDHQLACQTTLWSKDSKGRDLSGEPIVVRLILDGSSQPRRATLKFHRVDRVPETVARSFIVKAGSNRLYAWVPRHVDHIHLHLDNDDRDGVRLSYHAALRVLSLPEAIARTAALRPRGFARVLRLLAKRNIRGVNFRFGRLYDSLSAPSYEDWLPLHRTRAQICAPPPAAAKPVIWAYIEDGPPWLREASKQSLHQQEDCTVHLLQPSEIVEALKDRAGFDPDHFWVRLPAGLCFERNALSLMARHLLTDTKLTACYCDEDRTDRTGRRRDPVFKPAWNPPLLRSGRLAVDGALIRLNAISPSADLAGDRDTQNLLETMVGSGLQVMHIPQILMSRLFPAPAPEPKPSPLCPASNLLAGPALGPVSIVIPTRDRSDLLAACIASIPFHEDNPVEIIVVDNDSREPSTLDLFEQITATKRAHILPLKGAFNFSRACNIGVAAASHDAILLLNNDIESTDPFWLKQMITELSDPDVGAVGALLMFPDGFVQHAGVTLGKGTVARHSYHFVHPDSGEDNGHIHLKRDVSAVTAACLLTRKSLWNEVGGMNEDDLAVAFNDVDYCLKLREIGKRIVFTPDAKLIHHESVSRGADNTQIKLRRFAEEERYMYERWGSKLLNDPYYNPNLSLSADLDLLDPAPRDLSGRCP